MAVAGSVFPFANLLPGMRRPLHWFQEKVVNEPVAGSREAPFFTVPPMNKNYPSIVMRTTQIPFRATASAMACALLSSQVIPAEAAPPDPFDGHRHLLTVKFNINRPVTDTEAKFLAVRRLLDGIDNDTPGVAEIHPAKDVSCDQCHAKDSVSVDHYGLQINEENPAKSCEKAGCHDLTTAGEMPFYAKPFAALDETKNAKQAKQQLQAAKALLRYTQDFRRNLPTRLDGLPTLSSFSFDVRAQDKKINNLTHDVPLAFFEPKNAFEVKKDADLLPTYAALGLADDVLGLWAQDIGVPTRLDGVVEARLRRADDLTKYLALPEREAAILGLLTNSQLVLRYLATLPGDSVDFVAAELAASLPAAVLKTDATTNDATTGPRRTITWEIPAAANDGTNAATITLQLFTEGSRTQPSTQLQFQRLASAMRGTAVQVLAKFQARYAAFTSDHARFTLTYQASQDAGKALLIQAMGDSKEAAGGGELRRTLTYNENTATGTVAAAGQVNTALDAMRDIAAANPAGIRRLRTGLRFKPDLTTVSQISGEVLLGSLPRVSVTAKQAAVAENGADKIVFTVAREAATAQPLNVYYSLGGTARAGKDYAKPKLRVTIPKGAASVDVAAKVTNDRAAEGAETVALLVAAKNEYTVPDPTGATVTILDDERP